ncbi:MAG TPA: nucleotidyltransferase domain-containing protein [Pyrinomonadaceae bacterium]|jgi:predicted nucleotidyltransferase
MRKKRPIDALFPKVRRDILAATYGQPDRWWYLSVLAQQFNTTPSSLQRELQSMVSSGILRRKRDGRRTYFQAESASPIFSELRGIIVKTLGVEGALKEVMAKFGDRIACAFLYGSVARRQEHALSDVDLMIIGSVGLSELSPSLRMLEKKFGREINVKCYSPVEFREKVEAENHFVTSVLKGEKTFLKGDKDELESLAGKRDRSAT